MLNGNSSKAAGSETRKRIWKIAEEAGYIPNHAAQALRYGNDGNRKYNIACIFARSGQMSDDPFFSDMFQKIQYYLMNNNCRVAYVNEVDVERNQHNLPNADGVIVLGRYTGSHLPQLLRKYRKIVYVGLNRVNEPYAQIICDGYEAARYALDYLYDLGHREIGYVGELNKEARFRSYKDTLRARGLEIPRKFVVETKQTSEGAYNAISKLFANVTVDELPTAFFCANDNAAIGVLKAASDYGIKIPEQLSVIGIDNIEEAQDTEPLLTSIDINKELMARLTVLILYDMLQNGRYCPIRVEVPFNLCKRESCGKAKTII